MRLCNELGVLYNDLAGACRQGFDIVCFHVDWVTRYVTYLRGRQSCIWCPGHNTDNQAVIYVWFDL